MSLQGATILAFVPVVFFLGGKAMSMAQDGFWIPDPSLVSILGTFRVFAGPEILALVFFCFVIVAPLSVRRMEGKWTLRRPLESLRGISLSIRLKDMDEILLLVMWLLLPIVLSFIISKIIMPIYSTRYLIIASPALYLLVAKGVSKLDMKRVIYPVLLIIFLLAAPHLANYYTHYQKAQWREVAETIRLDAQKNDVIIFDAPGFQRPFDYYYHDKLEKSAIEKDIEDSGDIASFVNDVVSGKERLWLILRRADPNPPIKAYMIDRYGNNSVIMEESFVRVRVLLFDLY